MNESPVELLAQAAAALRNEQWADHVELADRILAHARLSPSMRAELRRARQASAAMARFLESVGA